MNSCVFRIGALCTALLAVGLSGAARAEGRSRTVSIDLAQVPLSQVVQLLASSAQVEIVFNDPEGKLADRRITYISLKDKTIDQALEKVCRAAQVFYERDKDGVYFISGQPLKLADAARSGAAAPALPEPETTRPAPVETIIQKLTLGYLDPNECIRMLTSSHTKRPLADAYKARDLDDLEVMPGLVDPATGQWYMPQSSAPTLPPIFAPGASKGAAPGVSSGQLGGFSGGFGGGPGGGFGGSGGFGGGGLGGGLGGGGLGGGLGGGGLGGGGLGGGGTAGLVPEGITGILGYPLDNSILVRGTPEDIEQLKRIIRLLDVPPRQLSIKIEQIAVTSNFAKQFGIDFNITYNDINVQGLAPFSATPGGLIGAGGIAVALAGDNWRARFSAAVTSGKASVIDSLTVTTMNNIPAFITQTSVSYIFIPTINQVAGSGLVTTFNPVQLQASTQLFAWPRINGDGTITMIIPFQLSRFTDFSVAPDGQRIPNQIFTIVNAIRRVASGQTIVVGGVINRQEQDSISGIPILKDLPVVGPLFRTKTQNRTNTETLFFFTPTILPDPIATGEGNL